MLSKFIDGPGLTSVAEDKFEAVDPLARVSSEQGRILFEDAIEMIPQEVESLARTFSPDAPLTIEDRADEKIDDRRFDEADELAEARASTRPTTPCGSICARWVPCRCSTARAKSTSPAASNAARQRPAAPCRAVRSSSRKSSASAKKSAAQLAARDILQFNDPIPTDETYEAGAREMLASCDELARCAGASCS